MSKLTPAERKERNRLRYENRKRKRSEKNQVSSANKQAAEQQQSDRNSTINEHDTGNRNPDTTEGGQSNPATYEKPTSESNGQLSRDKFAKTRLIWTIINSVFTLLFTGAVAVFSYWQVYYGNKQWEAMEAQNKKFDTQITIMQREVKQTDDNLDLMRREQRPWISMTKPEVLVFEPDKEISIKIPIKNFGSGPGNMRFLIASQSVHDTATGLSIDSKLTLNERLTQMEALFATKKNKYSFFGSYPPQGDTSTTYTGTPIGQVAFDAIMSGKNELYVYLLFQYIDGFDQLRTTRVCMKYNPATKEMQANGDYNRMD